MEIAFRPSRHSRLFEPSRASSGTSCCSPFGRLPRRQHGATLIEVLVAVVVSSFGLLGMAGLLSISAKVNNSAYLNTQANFIAQSFIESMKINVAAVGAGAYNGSYSGSAALNMDCVKHGCSSSSRASYDRSRFDVALNQTLPNAHATLACAPSSVKLGYDGTCKLQIDWSERALAAGGSAGEETASWIFQP